MTEVAKVIGTGFHAPPESVSDRFTGSGLLFGKQQVFIMLIFFIVTATFIKQTGADPRLAEAVTSKPKPTVSVLVGITANGDMLQRRPEVVRMAVDQPRQQGHAGAVDDRRLGSGGRWNVRARRHRLDRPAADDDGASREYLVAREDARTLDHRGLREGDAGETGQTADRDGGDAEKVERLAALGSPATYASDGLTREKP